MSVFHGGLHPSPGGRRVVPNGWHWYPYGTVVAWNLRAWLTGLESAWPAAVGWAQLDGCRAHWNRPVTWLDENRLAVGGLGAAEDLLADGVTVYEFSTRTASTGSRSGSEVTVGGCSPWTPAGVGRRGRYRGLGSGGGRPDRRGPGVPAHASASGHRRATGTRRGRSSATVSARRKRSARATDDLAGIALHSELFALPSVS